MQSCLEEQDLNTSDLCLLEDYGVGYVVTPVDVRNGVKTAQVEVF